jgi:hypothetical protein
MNPFGEVMKIHTTGKVVIPQEIVGLLNDIHRNLPNKNVEFGIYCNSVLDLETFTVTIELNKSFIPKQIVSSVTIEFIEGKSFVGDDFNTVIHRHPEGVNTFSNTDKESINKNWDVSILFIPPYKFPQAIINIDITPTSRLQIQASVEIAPSEEDENLINVINSKIGTGKANNIHEDDIDYPDPPKIAKKPFIPKSCS